MLLWFTGLSAAGKTSIANAADAALQANGHATYLLDGDHLRHGLCRDLGFSPQDRAENIRRVGEVARLMVDAGLVVLAAFISPARVHRDSVRALFAPGEFQEIHVSTPIEVCEARDPKGLYRLARAGELAEFTGVTAPYEAPASPELVIDTSQRTLDECARDVLAIVSAFQGRP